MRLELSRLARTNFVILNIEYYSNITRVTRITFYIIFDLKSNIFLIYDLSSIFDKGITL